LSNLRTGNSLVGADIDDLRQDISYAERLAANAGRMVEQDSELKAIPSDNADEVHEKQEITARSELLRSELEEFADEAIRPWFPDGVEHVFHWEIEFPEVFFDPDGSPAPGYGFDAVVGNPPYLKIQSLDRELASFCRNRYEAAHGSFDIYLVFIERSFGILGTGGRLGFIVPNKFMKLDSASRLRGLLADGRITEEIVDFGDTQIFEGATNYTCILELNAGTAETVKYTRVTNEGRLPLPADIARSPVQTYDADELGANPWILLSGQERSVIDAAEAGSSSLEEVTTAIFTGLQTSADPVYIVHDLGAAAGGRRVYSSELDEELILEQDLLHPIASGKDVDRWAFKPLDHLLIFPYKRDGESMRLLTAEELAALPATCQYLSRNEERLRGRESGKMDHADWYGYVYPKSLGLHDLPKLGVPRLCERLRTAIDHDGAVYLDNVDVNGIVPSGDGPPQAVLAALLNSRLLDYVFRLGSVPFRGAFFSANKQFIAPLPIRVPDGHVADELETLAEGLSTLTRERNEEKRGFLDWLAGTIEVPLDRLAGHTALASYDALTLEQILALLRRNRPRIEVNVDSRQFAERLQTELDASLERLGPIGTSITEAERRNEDAVFDLYGLSATQRQTVNAEYER
jgi:hypothetical protein